MLTIDRRLRPLDTYEGHKIVLAVHHYFAEYYRNPIVIPEVSQNLGISLIHIETAFDLHKGLTATQALLEYRLNRLCDHMHRDPSEEIGVQINQCGLGSGQVAFSRTDLQFIACFGIDLIAYHQQCFLTKAARLQIQAKATSFDDDDEYVGSPSRSNLLLTRFHNPA